MQKLTIEAVDKAFRTVLEAYAVEHGEYLSKYEDGTVVFDGSIYMPDFTKRLFDQLETLLSDARGTLPVESGGDHAGSQASD